MLSFPPLNMQTWHRFFLESLVCHEKENLVYVYVYRLYLHFNMQNNTYIFGMQKSVINGSTPPLLAQHNKIMAKLYVCMYHSIYPHGIILINMHVMSLSKMITYYQIMMCFTRKTSHIYIHVRTFNSNINRINSEKLGKFWCNTN